MLSRVVTEVAAPGRAAVLLVGGGDGTSVEVKEHLRQRRPIVVLGGSGRMADEVATGAAGERRRGAARPAGRTATCGSCRCRPASRRCSAELKGILGGPGDAGPAHRREPAAGRSCSPCSPSCGSAPRPSAPLLPEEARREYPQLADRIDEADRYVAPGVRRVRSAGAARAEPVALVHRAGDRRRVPHDAVRGGAGVAAVGAVAGCRGRHPRCGKQRADDGRPTPGVAAAVPRRRGCGPSGCGRCTSSTSPRPPSPMRRSATSRARHDARAPGRRDPLREGVRVSERSGRERRGRRAAAAVRAPPHPGPGRLLRRQADRNERALRRAVIIAALLFVAATLCGALATAEAPGGRGMWAFLLRRLRCPGDGAVGIRGRLRLRAVLPPVRRDARLAEAGRRQPAARQRRQGRRRPRHPRRDAAALRGRELVAALRQPDRRPDGGVAGTTRRVVRLQAIGARQADAQPNADLVVLLDPEGNEFCLLRR